MPLTEIQELRKDIREIAGFVQTLAKAVLTKDEGDYDEMEPADEYGENKIEAGMGAGMDDEPYDDPLEKHGDMGGGMGDGPNDYDDMNGEPVDLMPEEDEFNDFQAAYKAIKAMDKQKVKKNRAQKKGYAGVSQTKRDEHDAPFGDKDSDLKGNESQPAGSQGGEREDETFGPGGMAYRKMRKDLNTAMTAVKELSGGVTVAKAITPGVPSQTDGEVTSPGHFTRDMQMQVKGMSFRQICKMREDVGDLPSHLIG